jgi:hypothetical protein
MEHMPAPSQVLACVPVLPLEHDVAHAPGGLVSVSPIPMLVQVPVADAHVWQVGQLDVPQQVPSTQLPLAHCEAIVQTPPFASLQLPLPSQACGETQAPTGLLSG